MLKGGEFASASFMLSRLGGLAINFDCAGFNFRFLWNRYVQNAVFYNRLLCRPNLSNPAA
jgi:hypothetical protein